MGRIRLVFIVGILLSLGPVLLAETPTTVNVQNSGPYLLQNFPNISIITNQDTLYLIDLDDYFTDDNGDEINFTYSTIENVTITIDSENRVSFYPDTGYEGAQTMQFFASDAEETADGNIFTFTVGRDLESPRWSNPAKNRATVYQSSHITFTASWTDNTGLEQFILSVNEGVSWKNYTSVPLSGLTNISSQKIQISASAGTTVSWRIYASDAYSNWNATTIQSFEVSEFDASALIDILDEDADWDGEEVGTETGDGGTTTTTRDPSTGGITAPTFYINIQNIKVSMRQGDNLTKIIQITNTGEQSISFIATLKGVEAMAVLSDGLFIISPGETKELLVDFNIASDTAPDQYYGALILKTEDEVFIPIVIDVKKFESKVSLTVEIAEGDKRVRKGGQIKASINIQNLQDVRETPAILSYSIKDFKGNIIDIKNEEIILYSSFEGERELTVPEEIANGEYIFYARILGDDIIDLDSDNFFVGFRFQIISFIKKLLYPIILIILIAIMLVLYLIYKRTKRKKKLLELYLLLNELRSLVKAGKTSTAIDIYKRIKVAYGQHIKKDFQENTEALRAELEKFSTLLKQNPVKKEVPKETASKKSPKIPKEPTSTTSEPTSKKEEPKAKSKEEPAETKEESKIEPKPKLEEPAKTKPKTEAQPKEKPESDKLKENPIKPKIIPVKEASKTQSKPAENKPKEVPQEDKPKNDNPKITSPKENPKEPVEKPKTEEPDKSPKEKK